MQSCGMYTSTTPSGKCIKTPFHFPECSAKPLAENGKEDVCKFPFTFRNKTYQACTYDYNPWLTAPQPWCSLLTGEWNFIIIFSPMFSVPVPGGGLNLNPWTHMSWWYYRYAIATGLLHFFASIFSSLSISIPMGSDIKQIINWKIGNNTKLIK